LLFRLLVLAALSLSPARVLAQYENGSVVGTIRDVSGAPIVGAAVKISNTATGSSMEARTDQSGNYEVPSLRVGVYTITASATGFSDAAAQNVTVSVGNRQRIDLTLKVGATETTV